LTHDTTNIKTTFETTTYRPIETTTYTPIETTFETTKTYKPIETSTYRPIKTTSYNIDTSTDKAPLTTIATSTTTEINMKKKVDKLINTSTAENNIQTDEKMVTPGRIR